MLEETVKAIRETEEEAARIAKEADTTYWSILEQGKEQAALLKAGKEQAVRDRTEQIRKAAAEESEQFLKQALRHSEQEIAALRESAAAKQAEAAGAVASHLV